MWGGNAHARGGDTALADPEGRVDKCIDRNWTVAQVPRAGRTAWRYRHVHVHVRIRSTIVGFTPKRVA